QVPIRGGRRVIDLPVNSELVLGFHNKHFPNNGVLWNLNYTIKPWLVTGNFINTVHSLYAHYIKTSYFTKVILGLRPNTNLETLNLNIKKGKLGDKQEVHIHAVKQDFEFMYSLTAPGDYYQIPGRAFLWSGLNRSILNAFASTAKFNFQLKGLKMLNQAPELYFALTIFNSKKEGGYFVPSLLTRFWSPQQKKEKRLRLYLDMGMDDANLAQSGKQAYDLHLNPSRFHEGKIFVYQKDQLSTFKIIQNFKLKLKATSAQGVAYYLPPPNHKEGSYTYRIYQTEHQVKVALCLVDSSGNEDYNKFSEFNQKNIRLKDFLKQKTHLLFADQLPIFLKPIFLYTDPDKGPQQLMVKALHVFINQVRPNRPVVGHILPTKGNLFNLTHFINLKKNEASLLKFKLWPTPQSDMGFAVLSNFRFDIDGIQHLKKIKEDLLKRQPVLQPNGHYHISKQFTVFAKKVKFRIQTTDGKIVLAASIEMNIQIKKSSDDPVKASTNAEGELLLLQDKAVDVRQCIFIFSKQNFNSRVLPAQVIKGEDLLQGRNTLSTTGQQNLRSLYIKFVFQQSSTHLVPIQNIEAELWGENVDDKGVSQKRKLLAKGKTDSRGMALFKIDPRLSTLILYGRIFPKLKTNNQAVGNISHYPGDWSARGLSSMNKKNITLELGNVLANKIGTANQPFVFQLNTTVTSKVVFSKPNGTKKEVPPGVYFNVVGEQSNRIYGNGITDLGGQFQYQLYNPELPERVFLRAGDNRSTEHTASYKSKQAQYSIDSVSYKARGAIRSRSVELLGGKKSFSKYDFIIDHVRHNPHVLFAFKSVYEVNTWLNIMTQKSAKPWKGTKDLVIEPHTETHQEVTIMRLHHRDFWSRWTIAHEYGHYIQFKMIGVNSKVIDPHYFNLITNPKSALTEGWAEFIHLLFDDRPWADVDKYRKAVNPKLFKVGYENKSSTDFVLDPNYRPKHSKNKKNLGESVEGAVAMYMLAIMELIMFKTGSRRLQKPWERLGQHAKADIVQHPLFADSSHLKDYQYLKSVAAQGDFNKFIWEPFLNSGGSFTTFVQNVMKQTYRNQTDYLKKIMERLNIQQ
ncbi:MAG: hypothetical protein AAF242_08385, partial [Bacteroidota bacterium]